MMMRTVKMTSLASLLSQSRYGFCINGFALLDPRKHTTMNHNHHNMHLDLYEFGQYPDFVHICSTAPRTYESQVIEIVAQTISKRTGVKVTPGLLNLNRNRSWSKFLSRDLNSKISFQDLYPSLLGKLAYGIFIKESRLTWVLEQKNRFDLTLSSFDAAQPETVGELIDRYNEEIEICVLTSNFGFAAEIDQAESPLERHEHEEQTKTYPGVMDLKRLEGDQKNFINQLLAFIH